MGARSSTGLMEGYWENMENSFFWPLLSWQSYVSETTDKLYIFIKTRKGHRIKKNKLYICCESDFERKHRPQISFFDAKVFGLISS